MCECETVQRERDVEVPGIYGFVTGIKRLIRVLNYFIACEKCGMTFDQALPQLSKNKDLTDKDVYRASNYKKVIDLTTF